MSKLTYKSKLDNRILPLKPPLKFMDLYVFKSINNKKSMDNL